MSTTHPTFRAFAFFPVNYRFDDTLKQTLRSSRIDTNQHIVSAIARATNPPKVFIAASGIGGFIVFFTCELPGFSNADSFELSTSNLNIFLYTYTRVEGPNN